MNVKNKKVIVTGAGNGIGKELVKQLLGHDAYVIGLDIQKEALNNLKKELNNDRLSTYVLDVSNSEDIKKFKTKYMKDIGSIDIIINNAGIIQPFVEVKDLTDDQINRVFNVNFFGPLNLIRAFLPELLNNKFGGFIVNVSSMGGFFPFPKQTVYGASKAALKIFTEGLYAELMNTDVKVMTVYPGAIATNITGNSGVKTKTTKEDAEKSNVSMTLPEDAAWEIIEGIYKDKFAVYIGSDCKFMKSLYKLSPRKAISFISKKMSNL